MAKRRRRRKPGDLYKLRQVLWDTIELVEHYLLSPHDRGETIDEETIGRLGNTLSQLSNTYIRALAPVAIEERIEELESEIEAVREETRESRIRA